MFSRAFFGIIASSKNNGVPLTQGIIYDDPNYYPAANGPSACNPGVSPPPAPPPMPTPLDVWYTSLLVGGIVYADSGGVYTWPSGWWKIHEIGGGDTAVELDVYGVIVTTYNC